jgi:hypothetical protein
MQWRDTLWNRHHPRVRLESVQQSRSKGGFDAYNYEGKSVASQMVCICAQSGWTTVVCIGWGARTNIVVSLNAGLATSASSVFVRTDDNRLVKVSKSWHKIGIR